MPLSEDDLLLAIAVSSYLKKNKRKRRYSVHPITAQRLSCGQFHTLFNSLRSYPDKFFSYFRMSISSFDELCSYVRPVITKQETNFRNSIIPEERLAVTLR
ncbi:hypothetical protein NQ314_010911 [Rhamnusium bicolor]|uniref:Maturase K n=1 Tax=Rhamnusium bicolor TaxID=1586634 RepID=A0AAV8XND8_9CUCU|nr:hypothetical protein NQ314_010911 [Rhamnusium bicolor]